MGLNNYKNSIKVAVGMSGGVDSSTTALLLQQKGYEVLGFTALMHDTDNAKNAVKKAFDVCQSIGIPHTVVDLRKEFQQNVIEYFNDSYKTGQTPNPCTHCNVAIKWGLLKKYTQEKMNADLYATGHYARIIKIDDTYRLYKGTDEKKDQSYMLFGLTQKDLAETLFPLGEINKEETRHIANTNSLPEANSKESQDICFIDPPDTAKKYLTRLFGEKNGDFIDITTGKIIGKHTGFYQYTIGQRKGIGIAASEPLYVVKLDPAQNIVYVGFKNTLAEKELTITRTNWQQPNPEKEFKAMVKFRYNSPAKLATVKPDNDEIKVIFDEEQYGIAPGQVAVVYDINNEYIISGGWIK